MTPSAGPVYVYPTLTVSECEAVKRAIGLAHRSPEAEADRTLLVQALGAISDAVARTMRNGPDFPPKPR